MPFIMFCQNKGCGKEQQPTLDPVTNVVHCAECGKPMDNVTDFAKRQMKTIGQTKQQQKETFAVKCTSCNKESRPNIEGKVAKCKLCNATLNLSAPFMALIKNSMKNA